MRPKEFITIIVMLLMSFAFPVKQINSQEIGWHQLNFVPTYPLYGVYCINYDTVVAVGANGYIIRTNDSGEHWDSIPSNTTNSLYRVHFVNQTTGYAVGEKGTILKTTDMGLTWENIGISTNLTLFSLSFINKDTGWVAGGEGDIVYTYGNKGILLKTTNGGTNWIIDSTYDKTVASVFFIDNDTGYIALNIDTTIGCIGTLRKTTNGGNSFFTIKQDSLFQIGFYTDIYFINDKIGFFVSSTPPGYDKDGIYKTTDFGNTWNKIVTQWSIKTMYVLDSCILYLMYSDMGGDGSFGIDSCLHTNLTCPFFIGMDLLNKDSGFCVIDKIYKRGILSNINEVEKQKIEIYPNPFKDKIIITLSSDIDILEINLMVYNSIGQKILYNPNLKNNHIIIDLADEPNGLYYLIIMDNNKIIRTEKIIKH